MLKPDKQDQTMRDDQYQKTQKHPFLVKKMFGFRGETAVALYRFASLSGGLMTSEIEINIASQSLTTEKSDIDHEYVPAPIADGATARP